MREPRRTHAIAVAAFVAGLALFVVFAALPFLTKQRDYPASITNPPALENVSLVVLRPGQRVCMDKITLDHRAGVARFKAGTYGKPGPDLALTIAGDGYKAHAAVRAGWADNATLAVPVQRSDRDRLVSACIRNAGDVKVALYAASDRARSRSEIDVGGRRNGASPQFGFWETRSRSVASRLGDTADRIATFRGPLSHSWLVWLLLIAFAVVVPVALASALWLARPDAGARDS